MIVEVGRSRRASEIRRAATLCAALGALSVSTSTLADEERVEVITVTAQKQEENIQTVPISVKALSSETLSTINADGMEDIVRLVPSASMTNLSRGGNNIQIRGLGSNIANVGTVAIYNDGVIAPDRIASAGTFAEQDPAMYDIDRVEFLRGPQGTLYGEGSFGGVINVISKRPDATKFDASFSGSTFSVEDGDDGNYDVAGMLNVPLMKDVLALRAVGYDYDHGGYIDAVNVLPVFFGAPPVRVKEDANTEKVTGGRVALGFTPGETYDVTLTGKTQKTEIGMQSYDSPDLMRLANLLGGTSFSPKKTQAVFTDASQLGGESTTDEVILQANAELGFGKLTSITGWGQVDVNNENTVKSNSDAWSEELRLASEGEGPLKWIVGGYYRSASRDLRASAFGGAISSDDLDQKAVFGQLYWTFMTNVTATLGLRYSDEEVKLTDKLNDLPGVSHSFDDWSPKFAIDWQINDATMAYISIAKGFRAGGVNVDESLGTDPTYSSGFDSDEIWNYEIGLKVALFDDRATINTAIFYIDWSDIQIDKAIASVINPPVQFIVVNGQDAHSYGIESDIAMDLGAGWQVSLGGSYVNAEYDNGTIDSATAGLGFPLDGEHLPSAPQYVLNGSVEKAFAVGSSGMQAYVRTDYTMRGSSYGDVPNEAPPGGSFKSGQSQVWNLRTGLRQNVWEVQVFATNLTNQHDSTYNFYDGGFADVHALLQPRTIGVNLKLRMPQR